MAEKKRTNGHNALEETYRQEETGDQGCFIFTRSGDDLGELCYRKTGQHLMTIDHTGVDPSVEGQGIGKRLVEKAIEYARDNDMKIIPLCTYAAAAIKRNSSWHQVLYNEAAG
jgi:uncharacterized protein